LGAICGCGLLIEGSEVDAFLVHKITDIPEAEIESLSKDIQTITPAQVEALTQFMQRKIDKIIEKSENKTAGMIS
jgi:hypothetical protein